MTIKQIYNLAIRLGIKADPRGVKEIKKYLGQKKIEYNELKQEEKEEFDLEKLSNPFSDTRILYGDENKEVKRILAGIDIDGAEVLLANQLAEKGKPIDLIIGHHPRGKALPGINEVMELQADLLADLGVPINIAESLIEIRMSEVARGVSKFNHNQTLDLAKILDIPFMCSHTACDNLVFQFVNKKIKEKKPETVKDVIRLLKSIPEYKEATLNKAGPMLFAGKEERRCGKIGLTETTGGTAGSKAIYKWLAQAGVGTIIGMHMEEEYKKEAEKYHLNVIIAGHMASDSIGMNLLLDEIEKQSAKSKGGKIEIIPCSGLIRINRNQK